MCWSFGSNSEGQLGSGRDGGEWSSTPVPWEGVAGGVTREYWPLIGHMSLIRAVIGSFNTSD